MTAQDKQIAAQTGILDRIQALENALLNVYGVVEVEFDLRGFAEGFRQIILVHKYDIPVALSDYYTVRRSHLAKILAVLRSFGLFPSGDRIEDYGEHWYIVRNCDSTW